jgi:hypothetical protein
MPPIVVDLPYDMASRSMQYHSSTTSDATVVGHGAISRQTSDISSLQGVLVTGVREPDTIITYGNL